MNNTYQTITNAITHQPSKESFVNKDYNVDLLIEHTINPKLWESWKYENLSNQSLYDTKSISQTRKSFLERAVFS